jgi:hypothetical protein
MLRVLGLFLVFVSWFGLSEQFDLKLAGTLLFGVFLICSEGLFGHLMFVEREKVRAHYRGRR